MDGACPVAVYLDAQNSDEGRRTQRKACAVVAELLGWERAECLPWPGLGAHHAAALKRALADRYAPNTVNRHLCAWRGMAMAAWRLGFIDTEKRERLTDIKALRIRQPPSGRCLEREELTLLRSAAGARDLAILALLYGGGLRRAEAASLHALPALESGSVRVRGKGDVVRVVPLPPWAQRDFSAGAPTGVTTARGIGRVVERLVERAALEAVSPHDLRRSYCTHMLEAGADVATVARLMGHASPQVTMRYDRRGERAKEQAAERLPEP